MRTLRRGAVVAAGKLEAAASSRTLVSRLMGLETEYATLVHDQLSDLDRELPSARRVYGALVASLRRRMPTAPGILDGDQLFVASGAVINFVSHPTAQDSPGGLVEIATPEVHSPADLLACQSGVDHLIETGFEQSDLAVDVRVLKNSADAFGHVYGCQENYEADVASGIGLWIYRGFVLLLWMTQVISSFVAAPIMGFIVGATLFKAYRVRHRTDGHEVDGRWNAAQLFQSLPSVLTAPLMTLIRWTHVPQAVLVRLVARQVAFRHQRKYLTALLASRISICGTGHLDHNGCYYLSAKAMAIDCVSDLGDYRGERPIYVFGHWLQQLCGKSTDSWRQTMRLFHRRQRLQIGLTDSNMSETAEYVKVGSVSLILDMIESGEVKSLPVLMRPLRSLRRIARDWNLVVRVPTSQGDMTALEIQSRYWKAARSFVDRAPANLRGEAETVLEKWKTLLDAATQFRRDANQKRAAIGRIDWLTKRWLIDRLGDKASWAQRKKIDLRYHELSHDGYFRRLSESMPDPTILSADQRSRRRRFPPSNSPAARRAWAIREFSACDEGLHVGWTYAEIGYGPRRKRMYFGNEVY